jgi:hypothetical protein
MKISKTIKGLTILLFMAGITTYFAACNNSVTTTPMTDNEYLTSVINGGNDQPESPLFANETADLNDSGAVADQDGGMNPIDSLKRWGRKVIGVNINVSITDYGDTVKAVQVTRTITGVFIIRGYAGGQMDSVNKPYTEVLKRTLQFKRIARIADDPRRNWKIYKVSMLDGQTTSPQVGKSQITINNVSVYVNNSPTPTYSLNGPDFTQNIFTTMYFGGSGIPGFNRGDNIRVVVSLNSNQTDTDYVAWHWVRNFFGFHRVPFVLTSSNLNGDRTYEKTFTIFANHKLGVFNGYISANTHKSLWDDNPSLFSSTTIGTPYKVLQ